MMHAYCYVPRPDIPMQHHLGENILAALEHPELLVSSNLRKKYDVDPSVMAASEASHTPLLDHMDMLVLEGGQNDPELGFFLAHAIVTKKPTLFLFAKGTRPHIFDLISQSVLPPTVVVAAYDRDKLPAVISAFIERVSGRAMKEVPRIKFTLRVTNAIDSFLDFKTLNTKLSKADFLREHIEKLMKQDEGWSTYRRRESGREKAL